MGLFKRMGDIISANLNEMVDKFEDPEKMLKQAVREMESAIRDAMDRAAKVVASEKLLSKQLAEHESQVEHWQKQAESAIGRGDDDSGRHALARKRENQKLHAALADQYSAAQASSQKLRRQIEAMRVRLSEAKRKLVVLTARKQAAETRKRLVSQFSDVNVNEQAFGKFDRMCEKVEQAEAEAEALIELSSGGDGLEFDADEADGSGDPDVEAEFRELKQKLGQASPVEV